MPGDGGGLVRAQGELVGQLDTAVLAGQVGLIASVCDCSVEGGQDLRERAHIEGVELAGSVTQVNDLAAVDGFDQLAVVRLHIAEHQRGDAGGDQSEHDFAGQCRFTEARQAEQHHRGLVQELGPGHPRERVETHWGAGVKVRSQRDAYQWGSCPHREWPHACRLHSGSPVLDRHGHRAGVSAQVAHQSPFAFGEGFDAAAALRHQASSAVGSDRLPVPDIAFQLEVGDPAFDTVP